MSAVFAFLMMGAAVALLTSFFPESLAALRAANRRLLARGCRGGARWRPPGWRCSCARWKPCCSTASTALALFSIGSPDLILSAAPAVAALAAAVRSTIVDAATLASSC